MFSIAPMPSGRVAIRPESKTCGRQSVTGVAWDQGAETTWRKKLSPAGEPGAAPMCQQPLTRRCKT